MYILYMCVDIYCIYSFSIRLLVDTQVSSVSWLLSVMLQWTLGCIYLFKVVFLFSSDKNSEMELLDNIVVLFLFFFKETYYFPYRLYQFAFPQIVHKDSLFSLFLLTFAISCLFDGSHFDSFEVTFHASF